MPIEVLMPALSPTMTEGNLAKWLVKEGDEVSSGDVIAEIETDKATMEVEAVDEGKIGKILVAEGTEGVAVNNVIALLLDEDEDAGALEGYTPSGSGDATSAKEASNDTPKESSAANGNGAAAPAPAPAASGSEERVKASPLARRIAEQSGIDLSRLQGSGSHGRIIKADVENAPAGGASAGVSAGPMPAMAGRNPQEETEIPLNNMRKTIARRLLESKQQVPHFYLSMECEIDALMAARKQLNDAAAAAVANSEQKPAYKISVNDMVIKAVAASLRDVPEANAAWGGDKIIQYNNVDISVAVAIEGGLITPIIRNADQKSLSVISNEMKDLAARARDNKLAPEEFQGGGFSISNLGMYGIKQFNAIINPPQACILAVGAGEEKLVMRDGQPKAINIMTVTVSSDHRVVDGALGAIFLQAFKRYIENPMAMMV